MEGFDIFVLLKSVFPHLRTRYMYHTHFDDFPNESDCPILANSSYIFLEISVKTLIWDVYTLHYLNKSIIHEALNCLSDEVLIIGRMTDPILVDC